MNAFYEHHRDSILWQYRCFDRNLLNGLIQPFQQPERVVGFFNTYRRLYPVTRHLLRGISSATRRENAGIFSSRSDGLFNTTSISTTVAGDGCLFACVPTFPSLPGSASINITGWPTGCVRKASASSNVPTLSSNARHPSVSKNSPTRSLPGTWWPAARNGWRI